MSQAQAVPAAEEGATDAEGHFIGHYQVAPGYMKDNDHITHGYRINFNTPRKIFRSLFMVHNESVNIWSHCLPALIILGLLFSFYLVVDQTVVKKSILACQTQIEEGLAHYSHALENLSLLADYRRLKEYTGAELMELQQTVLTNYQQFSTKLKEGTAHYQFVIEQEVQGIRSNIKNTLKQNLVQFQKVKIQFEKTLAPMLVDELSGKLNKDWAGKLKATINELKEQIDSQDFQYVQLRQQRPNPQEISRWPIFVFLGSAALCLLTSTIFHLFYPMSSRTYTITNRFDYAGVNLLISGSSFPPLYYGMYCQLAVATLYLTCILITATFCFVVCLFEWIHRPGHQKYKAFLFGGFGVSMLIPISHMLINEVIYDNYGDPFEFSTSLPYYLLLGASYLTGLYVYTVRCPERNNPGRYNICGHSHQIWHGMVVLGIFFTYLGVLQNFEMRKSSFCPA